MFGLNGCAWEHFCVFQQGIGPRVLWIGIGGSIFFGVLESTKRILAERRLNPPHNNTKMQ